MFLQFLAIETAGACQIVNEPKWPAIQAAIKGLNGQTNTMVCLVAKQAIHSYHMNIGGGAEDRVVVGATFDQDKFYMLVEPARGTALVEAKVNGQVNEYPAELLVSRDAALKAAKLFSDEGKCEPSLLWRSTAEQGEKAATDRGLES